MSRLTFAWLGLMLLLSSGCSSVPFLSMNRFQEADDQHPVGEILCVWEAAEGRGVDNLPCRGFGGQVLLFANGYKEPVKAMGDVRIYVFDELGVDGDSSKPVHQFDFPALAWNTFLKPSNLGASYQIFIPYTRKGSHAASCTLRVRFTPEGGLPVYSRMATVELAGHSTTAHPDKRPKQIVTVSGESEPEQAIETANWSDLKHDPQGVADANESHTPSIPLGAIQSAHRQTQTLNSLRAAAEEATRDSESPDQPAESATEAPRRLRSTQAEPLDAGEDR